MNFRMSQWGMRRTTLIAASLVGFLGVLIGAFGAHSLPTRLHYAGHDEEKIERRMQQFKTGVDYHLVHAVALLALAGLPFGSRTSRRTITLLFLIGCILFSGSLYLLVLLDQPKFGMVTPIGGIAWLIAWLALVWVAISQEDHVHP